MEITTHNWPQGEEHYNVGAKIFMLSSVQGIQQVYICTNKMIFHLYTQYNLSARRQLALAINRAH